MGKQKWPFRHCDWTSGSIVNDGGPRSFRVELAVDDTFRRFVPDPPPSLTFACPDLGFPEATLTLSPLGYYEGEITRDAQ